MIYSFFVAVMVVGLVFAVPPRGEDEQIDPVSNLEKKIFHTKTMSISPEVIDKITWMFKELASIAPVYSILGNHYGNLTNDNRQDTISPIITAMNDPRITLFKKSGNHILPNTFINLCVLSCFDEAGWNNVQTDKDLINIAMFHGSVRGCVTDSDWVMTHGEAEISMFERFDFAFLGDIHKEQFLGHRSHEGITRDMKPWIGYPGSLIQQNYGEDVVKGYHVWDIRANYPDARLDWVVEEGYVELLTPLKATDSFKGIDHIIPISLRRWKKNLKNGELIKPIQEFIACKNALQEVSYDIVIETQGLIKSALVTKFVKKTPNARQPAQPQER